MQWYMRCYINQPVKIVRGDYYNIKLTTPEDIIIARGLLMNILIPVIRR